jgi:predicted transcriptional regulator
LNVLIKLDTMPRRFTSKEERMIGLLMDMAMPRSLARTIVFFSKNENCICNNIQEVTDLRQPEVSTAMQYLKERGWIITESLQQGRKGRPIISYKLAIPFDKMINTLIREEHAKIKDLRVKLNNLKKLTK